MVLMQNAGHAFDIVTPYDIQIFTADANLFRETQCKKKEI